MAPGASNEEIPALSTWGALLFDCRLPTSWAVPRMPASGASAVRVIATWADEELRGCHVPVQRPSLRETMVRGGSPLEKVATTDPLPSGLPQSSTTRASRDAGQEVETPNCSGSEENKGSSRVGAQPAPYGGLEEGDVTPGLST